MKTIEESTPLLPDVVASLVCAEVSPLIDRHPVAVDPAASLAERAEVHFQRNPEFRKRISGKDGREYLYAFMRHWLAGMLLKAGCPRSEIPADWTR